jgi:hypothetical protein
MDRAFTQDRLTKTKALIVKYEDALDALITDGVQAYTLDTGQSVQNVTKLDIGKLQRQLDVLYNRCAVLQTRLTGSGTTRGVPAW